MAKISFVDVLNLYTSYYGVKTPHHTDSIINRDQLSIMTSSLFLYSQNEHIFNVSLW